MANGDFVIKLMGWLEIAEIYLMRELGSGVEQTGLEGATTGKVPAACNWAATTQWLTHEFQYISSGNSPF